jgi:hypothetical protein
LLEWIHQSICSWRRLLLLPVGFCNLPQQAVNVHHCPKLFNGVHPTSKHGDFFVKTSLVNHVQSPHYQKLATHHINYYFRKSKIVVWLSVVALTPESPDIIDNDEDNDNNHGADPSHQFLQRGRIRIHGSVLFDG